MLLSEFGFEISAQILRPMLFGNDMRKQKWKDVKFAAVDVRCELEQQCINEWPQQVSKDIIFHRLNEYYEGTVFKAPPVCAVCSCQHFGHLTPPVTIQLNDNQIPPYLSVLLASPENILSNLPDEFQFIHPLLHGLMLDKHGIHIGDDHGSITLDICDECYSPLVKSMVPHFALANRLYRGHLPDEFSDLTWVEERACAIYSNNAIVTHLYQSSDPSQPKIYHGNTCAHEMDVVSTVSVLPRTPTDITGQLSVVFIGPEKFQKERLHSVFRVCKIKIWQFLMWLKSHNQLYTGLSFSDQALSLFLDDGPLPGIEHCVIEDNELDVAQTFHEESAGFDEHPAELTVLDNSDAADAEVFLERSGVSDPECHHISGRSLTAAAL